jgi:hypothetical protein
MRCFNRPALSAHPLRSSHSLAHADTPAHSSQSHRFIACCITLDALFPQQPRRPPRRSNDSAHTDTGAHSLHCPHMLHTLPTPRGTPHARCAAFQPPGTNRTSPGAHYRSLPPPPPPMPAHRSPRQCCAAPPPPTTSPRPPPPPPPPPPTHPPPLIAGPFVPLSRAHALVCIPTPASHRIASTGFWPRLRCSQAAHLLPGSHTLAPCRPATLAVPLAPRSSPAKCPGPAQLPGAA